MSKYSDEFKLQVVKYCIEEHHGYTDAANHFNMKQNHTVLKWVRKYQEHEEKGLITHNERIDLLLASGKARLEVLRML